MCVWLTGMLVQSKFEEIRKSNQAAAQRFMEGQISSSSEDDDDDDNDDNDNEDYDTAGDHDTGKKGRILASTFNTYTNQTGELQQVTWNMNIRG